MTNLENVNSVNTTNKLPIVIPYVNSGDGGQELRYALRSFKNIKQWNGEVIIIGDKEGWFKNITFIPCARITHTPIRDVENKMQMIQKLNLTDFIFANDDMYITKPLELEYLHKGELVGNTATFYQKMKLRTANWLKRNGIDQPLDYGVHVPMIMNKDKRLAIAKHIINSNWTIQARSLYGNLYKVGGKLYEDKKTRNTQLPDGDIISTLHFTGDLKTLFPKKSRFEGMNIDDKPIVHIIWIGSPLPERYRANIESYKKHGYEVKLWTEAPPLKNQALFDNAKSWAVKADIMRLEILLEHGGLYTDADSHMNKPLPLPEELVCMTSASGYIANETIYCTKGHKALKEAVDKLQAHYEALPDEVYVWEVAGATYITPIFEKYSYYKYDKNEIGSAHRNPKYIAHSYAGSWAAGLVKKTDKKRKDEW